jgi:uncharacterized protein
MIPKLSHYTIFSDPVNANEDFILFSTRTSKATVLSKSVRDCLLVGNFESIAPNIYSKLLEDQCIVDENEHELMTIVNENKSSIDTSDQLYEVIQPSAMCQLGCDYCGQAHQKKYLKNDLFENLISRIRNKAKLKDYKHLFIGWFGGEPLMALPQIRELTPMLKSLADELNLTYGAKIVTNGLSLKENIFKELATNLSIKTIEITLDGTSEFHDQRRHTKEGGATFDLIFNNILKICNLQDFRNYNCSISIRCNVDHRNCESVSPLIKLLAEKKLQNKISYFYTMGVYSWGGNDAHVKSLTKEEYAKKEIDWMIEMLEHGFVPSLLPQRQKQVCMAVSKISEMYDPYGNIFNCTEVSLTSVYEKSPYMLGNLAFDSNTIVENKPLNDWNDTLLTDRFPCHSCKMLPVCGGGCPKSWHEDMRACPSNKFNIKEKLLLSYLVSNDGIKIQIDNKQ